ncbi:Cof-type HAD-IIB family hydrolase [Lacticaseibacillus camelliae]|uniref:HAD superfamily hydrolase n=1 Tax=Lacticaseibacillus camelliae DSM 22697 = JCM 13995 TaxID=1423730 RepID=A0A0R2F9B6_9LACO|nr:Cof-type HAD-IIB family hydrolase [Lacticaseibacillus camelliae]KRN21978.1 HAD superfamily hydrolase [Lacticaseibacillus camelliae DSM 22697 = JCM 13995]
MNRKLIALDLDGTTLNQDSQLSAKTIATLRAARDAGHLVVITTGRPDSITENFYDQIGLTGPMINFNGGLIQKPHQQWDRELQATIPIKTALQLLDLRQDFDIRVMVAEGKQLLRADHAYSNIPFLPDLPHPAHLFDQAGLTRAPISVTLFVDGDLLQPLTTAVHDRFPQLVAKTWGAWSGEHTALEITTAHASKSRAVAYVAGAYGIAQPDILAFGDDLNDLDMIEYAGVGVAMQNARPAVLNAANAVTPADNAHDGVARFLQAYLHLAA